jgi:phage terminase large subunit-like protein
VEGDHTDQLSSAQWSKRAVSLYQTADLDRIVGETNNGGDLIESVLRTAGSELEIEFAYKKVTASRGKRTRAEPISSLYEQGRAHHVGTFAELEDQMTTWVPGLTSPDRMDALVWGATEVMILGDTEEDVFG